jgi:O-antigen/teichoic acid export membrane protein
MIKKFLKKNSSIFIMLLASGLYFTMTILLKRILSLDEFGEIALLLSIISMLWSFGLLGMEQVFLRYSYVEKNKLFIPFNIMIYLNVILCIGSLCFTLIFIYYDFGKISNLSSFFFFLFSLSLLILLFSYNYFRIKLDFNISQLYANGWKIVISLLFIIFIFNNITDINFLIYTLIVVVSIISIIAIFHIYLTKPILINKKIDNIISLSFQFFISLLLLSILSVGDRFIIENFYGSETLGKYFYYLTVILFPFSFVQSYLGFKILPFFKNNFSLELLHEKMIMAFKVAIYLSIFILLTIYLIYTSTIIDDKLKIDDFKLLFLIILLGIIRVIYSVLSSALGARTNNIQIKRINIKTILYIGIVSILLFLFKDKINLYIIVFCVFILYVVRVNLFYKELVHEKD